ncbi:GNAT family N-acetyltransferase [Helicovermis profundi]|uniref:Spermidine N1-acetyltransferase n=1 Tax=Helicovermis profundi TaxID=3065157 RepID=A0AAU9E500_9FIRM|nr:spermidine N1-acetyltransferase [Clostridia bacterium S502]
MFNVFTSERLLIRNANETDIEYIMDLENQDENKGFVYNESFETHLKQIKSENELLFIVEEAKSKDKVGFILSVVDELSDVFELRRIVIEKKSLGYGTEVIKGLMKYAFNNGETNRFWLDAFSNNDKGIHIYEKLGMTREGILREAHKVDGKYIDLIVFSILKSEFKE